jgi:hypothetical protein
MSDTAGKMAVDVYTANDEQPTNSKRMVAFQLIVSTLQTLPQDERARVVRAVQAFFDLD